MLESAEGRILEKKLKLSVEKTKVLQKFCHNLRKMRATIKKIVYSRFNQIAPENAEGRLLGKI